MHATYRITYGHSSKGIPMVSTLHCGNTSLGSLTLPRQIFQGEKNTERRWRIWQKWFKVYWILHFDGLTRRDAAMWGPHCESVTPRMLPSSIAQYCNDILIATSTLTLPESHRNTSTAWQVGILRPLCLVGVKAARSSWVVVSKTLEQFFILQTGNVTQCVKQ